ncbi:MAG TPA: DUF3107 domain-containing protein [Pseudonocardiaceae bacterium]
MEVKIGVAESPRELTIQSGQTPEEVEALVGEALKDPKALLSLSDDKGRRFVIPSARISYVEIAAADSRRVGFAIT